MQLFFMNSSRVGFWFCVCVTIAEEMIDIVDILK